jgi:hypothetical protein
VRIEYKKEGGIAYVPALAKPVVIDTSQLNSADQKELQTLLEQASFHDLPETVGTVTRGAADVRTHSIRIEGPQGKTVRVVDPSAAPGVNALVQWLDNKAKQIRKAGPGH